jgi:hypothetical protein
MTNGLMLFETSSETTALLYNAPSRAKLGRAPCESSGFLYSRTHLPMGHKTALLLVLEP